MMVCHPPETPQTTSDIDTTALRLMYDVTGSAFRERHARLADAAIGESMNGRMPSVDMIHGEIFAKVAKECVIILTKPDPSTSLPLPCAVCC